MHANLSAARLEFLTRFASTEETRFYLGGVHVEPLRAGGVVMVATDGHVLGLGLDPDGEADSPFTLDTRAPAIRALVKVRAAEAERARVKLWTVPDMGIHLADRADRPGAPALANLIDGPYPDWRRVVPWAMLEAEPAFTGYLNPENLTPFLARYAGQTPCLALRQAERGHATLVQRSDAGWFLGVVMPMLGIPGFPDAIRALAPKGGAA